MYQRVKDEPFVHPEEKEEKIYQVQLGQRKQNDIFSQPSSSDFMKLLQLEVGDPTSTGQKNVEKICWRKGRSILNLSRTKCPVRLIDLLNQSHGPNSAFRNLNLEAQKLLKTTHHLLTSLQDWADTTRTRILGSMRKCRISELLQISKGQHRWTSKCTFH